jgi:hypothetical protein
MWNKSAIALDLDALDMKTANDVTISYLLKTKTYFQNSTICPASMYVKPFTMENFQKLSRIQLHSTANE